MIARPVGVIASALVLLLTAIVLLCPSAASSATSPLNNDCSAGYVQFTFDDGPSENTAQLIQTLKDLRLTATFFIVGNMIDSPAAAQLVRDEYAAGFSVQNHTWDHKSFNGVSTNAPAMTQQQVTDELEQTSDAIVAAGVPKPTLYRPPYGDISAYYDLIARNLGYRIVMPWGANIADSRDWTDIGPAEIASNVLNGYTLNGVFKPGIKADSIISMHDGSGLDGVNTIGSLQAIVNGMNSKHLCATSTIRSDATGGVVPAPAPPAPTEGNLVQNASLETVRLANTPAAEPTCFQQAGASVANTSAVWSLTSDAHSGSVAESVNVTSWKTSGDRKLVLTQRQSESACLTAVTPGKTYTMWAWYKGSWDPFGTTKVSIATYYRNSSGAWVYWQGSPLYPPTSAWNLAYFTSAPLPAGATAISYGVAISGIGSLTTDDYTMVAN